MGSASKCLLSPALLGLPARCTHMHGTVLRSTRTPSCRGLSLCKVDLLPTVVINPFFLGRTTSAAVLSRARLELLLSCVVQCQQSVLGTSGSAEFYLLYLNASTDVLSLYEAVHLQYLCMQQVSGDNNVTLDNHQCSAHAHCCARLAVLFASSARCRAALSSLSCATGGWLLLVQPAHHHPCTYTSW